MGPARPWPEREPAIIATLADARPDIAVLTESWSRDGDSQCARLAAISEPPDHPCDHYAVESRRRY